MNSIQSHWNLRPPFIAAPKSAQGGADFGSCVAGYGYGHWREESEFSSISCGGCTIFFLGFRLKFLFFTWHYYCFYFSFIVGWNACKPHRRISTNYWHGINTCDGSVTGCRKGWVHCGRSSEHPLKEEKEKEKEKPTESHSCCSSGLAVGIGTAAAQYLAVRLCVQATSQRWRQVPQ